MEPSCFNPEINFLIKSKHFNRFHCYIALGLYRISIIWNSCLIFFTVVIFIIDAYRFYSTFQSRIICIQMVVYCSLLQQSLHYKTTTLGNVQKSFGRSYVRSVSYTHLDVYKRQVLVL